ncbi:MAG: hypothetical protein KAH22_09015 [Thiotrichaceae bacterium]|nr:hypothetical protein [Thiotrichaceae bacterium]
MINNNIPSNHVSSFTDERLAIIGNALLEQCYETDDDLQSIYDSGYSIGCTRFDRQKNCLIEMSYEYDWLEIIDASNRLVMTIDNVPFRFTNDDYLFPKKKAALEVSETEAAQFARLGNEPFQMELDLDYPNIDHNKPTTWRFYINVTQNIEDEVRDYEVSFVGRNLLKKPCCTWNLSNHQIPYLVSTDNNQAEVVKTKPAKTTLPNTPAKRKTSNDK